MLESNRSKRLKATVHFNKNNNFELLRPAAIPRDADDPSATANKPAKKDRKALKLSTAVTPLPQATVNPKQSAKDSRPAAAVADQEQGKHATTDIDATTQPTSALFGLHPVMQTYLAQQGFTEPTDIQQRMWPLACSGRDILAQVRLCYSLPSLASPTMTNPVTLPSP